MKVVLDLTDLVAKGKLTAAEAERLKGLAARDTGALGVNILLAFGTVAVALGAGVLVPDLWTVVILGAALFAVGFGLTLAQETRWSLFAQITMTIGALAAGGALWVLTEGDLGLNTLVVLEIFHLFFIRNIHSTSLTWAAVRGRRRSTCPTWRRCRSRCSAKSRPSSTPRAVTPMPLSAATPNTMKACPKAACTRAT